MGHRIEDKVTEWIDIDTDKHGIIWVEFDEDKDTAYYIAGESYKPATVEKHITILKDIEKTLKDEGISIDWWYDTERSYRAGNDIWTIKGLKPYYEKYF